MTFREAVLEACRRGEAHGLVAANTGEALEAIHARPFWTLLQMRLAFMYRLRTGQRLPEGNALIDAWEQFITFLIAQAPAIIEIIKVIIALFA